MSNKNKKQEGLNLFSHAKIKDALSQIKVQENCVWYVPNRESLNMDFNEFIEFERQRILEFQDDDIIRTKYKYHYYPVDEKED